MVSLRGRDARGRPEKIYALPQALLGDDLAGLSDALLTGASSQASMDALAERLAGEVDSTTQPLAKRLNQTVEKLNQMKYHAHWEAGAEGPRILFGHCPYLAILEKHPELCRVDQAMLKQMLGQPARLISRTGEEGSTVCVFMMIK